ncbi:MAG TPA: MBL fold metallo-hydrolase [Candidatus Bathyarchaeia archaeon]|nr:MBL fold metallo-hydrolase [Candidatus Bathyarchaeia archaeon]
MIVKTLTLGALDTNCYVIWDEKSEETVVIDPAFSTEGEGKRTVLRLIETRNLSVRFIVNTHGHADHTCGNGTVKKATGAPILVHEFDAPLLGVSGQEWASLFGIRLTSPPADKILREGDKIAIGETTLNVLHTPGHTLGGISLATEDSVFVGDTLFKGSIGRTDIPGGSYEQIIKSIKEKLARLPDNFVVYPGHGPTTTIGEEKRTNPYLLFPEP